jgi:hypothetical protein
MNENVCGFQCGWMDVLSCVSLFVMKMSLSCLFSVTQITDFYISVRSINFEISVCQSARAPL